MKGLGSAVKVGASGGGRGGPRLPVVEDGERAAETKRFHAFFKDASGLYDKSRVVIAGLTIGEVGSRDLVGSRAKVSVRVQRKIVL